MTTVWPINTGARNAFGVTKVFKCGTATVRAVHLLTALPHAQHDSSSSTAHKGTVDLEKPTPVSAVYSPPERQ